MAPAVVFAADIPLDRNPRAYLILGMQRVRVSSLTMEPPGCNVGVNCASQQTARGGCGFFHSRNAHIPEPGQVAANRVCGTGSFFQVFSNLPTCADPTCAAIMHPAPTPDCTERFTPPILGDLDGDGRPSCDSGCMVDEDDIARACGVFLPLPDCDPSRPVTVDANLDCSTGDIAPGNGRCDLGAGTYGALSVGKGARIDFAPGMTVICSLDARSAARVTSTGPATVLVPGMGAVSFNNSADVGSECMMLRIVTEQGLIKLGRYGDYTLDACTIRGVLRLGHGNNLRGHFVGSAVASDVGNEGMCCPLTTTTSTTTSTTASSSTSSSTTSSSTTTSSTSTTATTAMETLPPSSSTSSSTTGSTSSSTSTSSSSTSSTSTSRTTSSSTTTTTVPTLFTRTPGFYKNHPDITQHILSSVGGLTVCGHTITDVDVNHGHSALEALCVRVRGDERLQLLRQLLTAALNTAAGGGTFADFATCDAVCRDARASAVDLDACIDRTDAFNQSGDGIAAPFDPPGPANPGPCQAAFNTRCTVLQPGSCAAP